MGLIRLVLVWADTDLRTAMYTALAVLGLWLAVGVPLLLWTFLPERPQVHPTYPIVDEPSGPIVPAADLLPHAEWIRVTDHRHPETVSWGQPYAWPLRYRGAHRTHRTGVTCDRTRVDEVQAIAEEVA